MFGWIQRSVSFMREASEYGRYYEALASRIAPSVKDKRVLDAGCGLGYLSLALAPYCKSVLAADREPLALNVLKENIVSHNINNIDVFEGDMFGFTPKEPFDAVVFCFFGDTGESLRLARRCLIPSGKVIMIKKAWKKHRFTLSGKAIVGHTLDGTLARLDELKLPYSLDKLELEMGQPLRSLSDAAEFFTIYDAEGVKASEADVKDRLVPIEHEEFAYYLPSNKQIGIITLDADNLSVEI